MLPATVQKVLATGLLLGLIVLNWVAVMRPVTRWAVLHDAYTSAEIREGNIRVARLFGRRSVIFSNGERREFGLMVEIVGGAM